LLRRIAPFIVVARIRSQIESSPAFICRNHALIEEPNTQDGFLFFIFNLWPVPFMPLSLILSSFRSHLQQILCKDDFRSERIASGICFDSLITSELSGTPPFLRRLSVHP